jgi:hypothetical protein
MEFYFLRFKVFGAMSQEKINYCSAFIEIKLRVLKEKTIEKLAIDQIFNALNIKTFSLIIGDLLSHNGAASAKILVLKQGSLYLYIQSNVKPQFKGARGFF